MMALKDKIAIELCTVDLYGSGCYYSTVTLPATDGEIEDAMQKARAIGREKYLDITVISCPRLQELMEVRFNSPTIKEMNFFAQRLESLSENQVIALNALFKTEKESEEYDNGVLIKDLINMTYDLDAVKVLPGISNDSELGEFVIDNEIEPYMHKLTDETIKLLDSEKVGKKFRESENGTFTDNHYVSRLSYDWPEVYDGRKLPETEEKVIGGWVMQMHVARSDIKNPEGEKSNTLLIGLPIHIEKANKIAQKLGEERIEDCAYFDFKSPMSWLDGDVYNNAKQFGKLNTLAHKYEALNPENRLKFKAVTESADCRDLDTAIEIIGKLDRYQLSHYTPDYESYAREYMQLKLPTEFDAGILAVCNLDNLGKRICDRLGCTLTDYGVVTGENGQLFATIVPEDDEVELQNQDEEQGVNEMQM